MELLSDENIIQHLHLIVNIKIKIQYYAENRESNIDMFSDMWHNKVDYVFPYVLLDTAKTAAGSIQ